MMNALDWTACPATGKNVLANWTLCPLWSVPMKSIRDLILKAGGATAIAEASRRDPDGQITPWAVEKWKSRGIPDEHWDLLMDLAGVTPADLYAINKAVRGSRAA